MKYSIQDLAADLKCSVPLARDLLRLAGGDTSLVLRASEECRGVESMKAFIIDKRIAKVEE